MQKSNGQDRAFIQDMVLDFSQIKYKHSDIFENLDQFNIKFVDFSLYTQVSVYMYENKDQRVMLRWG